MLSESVSSSLACRQDVCRECNRAGRLVRREPSSARKSLSRLYGAGESRFHKSPHPNNFFQAGGDLDGTPMVSVEHGRNTTSAGAVVLTGL